MVTRNRERALAVDRARQAVVDAWNAGLRDPSKALLFAAGRSWYPRELARLEVVAECAPVRLETLVGAAATLSPATSWSRVVGLLPFFVVDALSGVGRPHFPTYGLQRDRAAWIVRSDSGLRLVTGPKVRPFALALLGNTQAVVIDRHAARIAGVCESHATPTAAEAAIARDGYQAAAAELGVYPRDLQATVWTLALGVAQSAVGPLVGVSEGELRRSDWLSCLTGEDRDPALGLPWVDPAAAQGPAASGEGVTP